jgi:hypothetical protein
MHLVYLEQAEHDDVLQPDGEVHEAVGRTQRLPKIKLA